DGFDDPILCRKDQDAGAQRQGGQCRMTIGAGKRDRRMETHDFLAARSSAIRGDRLRNTKAPDCMGGLPLSLFEGGGCGGGRRAVVEGGGWGGARRPSNPCASRRRRARSRWRPCCCSR